MLRPPRDGIPGPRAAWLALLVAGRLAADGTQAGPAAADPFAFFRPTVVVTEDERRQLERGEPVTRALPSDGRVASVLAAIPVVVEPDRFVALARQVEAFKRNAHVQAIHRFSDPPRLEDLATLTLDSADVDAIPRCRPGSCGLKLAADEMVLLQRAASRPGVDRRQSLDVAFREVVLRRVVAYLKGGREALPVAVDRREPTRLGERFAMLVDRTAFLQVGSPRLADALVARPDDSGTAMESFLYWSKEDVGGKPIVAVTHMHIARHDDGVRPDVLVTGAGIFATHYATASLGLTALVGGRDGRRYLVYVNRSEVDGLDGLFSAVARRVIERRFKSGAAIVLRDLRARLEQGDPP